MSSDALVRGYAEICSEFVTFYDTMRRLLREEGHDHLVKGRAIVYSDLIYKPDFLFIGFNPNGWMAEDLNPLKEFEYIAMEDCGDGVNSLSRQTRELFKETKYYDRISKAMKTNLFYYGTRNLKDFHKVTTVLNEHGINPYSCAFDWTRKFINLIQPKVIVCEGKIVHDKLAECYGAQFNWQGNHGSGSLLGSIAVISYARLFSTIMDKVAVVEAVNKLVL